MAELQDIDVGAVPNDGTGDHLRAGGIIVNSNNAIVDSRVTGFLVDGDTTGSVALTATVWTDIPNDTLGPGSNTFPPAGVTGYVDDITGYINASEMENGDSILIRSQFFITPNSNNTILEFRALGLATSAIIMRQSLPRMSAGAAINYHNSIEFLVALYNDDFRTNDIKLQVRVSGTSTLLNAGLVIQGFNRKGA